MKWSTAVIQLFLSGIIDDTELTRPAADVSARKSLRHQPALEQLADRRSTTRHATRKAPIV
jgi:hypothetical protein